MPSGAGLGDFKFRRGSSETTAPSLTTEVFENHEGQREQHDGQEADRQFAGLAIGRLQRGSEPLLINSGEQTARARQYRQQSDAQQYPRSTANNLLRRIDESGVTIWKERLCKLKRNGAAENHKANGAWTSRITEIKQETEQAKRADVFKHNHKAGLGLGQLWSQGVGRQRGERNESE